MRSLTLVAIVSCLAGLPLCAAPLEEDAILSSGWTREHAQRLADDASMLIRRAGYRCDSIANLQRWVYSSGFTVSCNGFRYTYHIEDKGGRWTVTLK